MVLKLIAEFDLFLAAHLLKHNDPGKGNTPYKLYQTYKQFIYIKAEEVKKNHHPRNKNCKILFYKS